ncbi:MAG: protein-tyrosine-phosphatase [Planctomycetota bacterium]
MTLTRVVAALCVAVLSSGFASVARSTEVTSMKTSHLLPQIGAFLESRAAEFDQISPERRTRLEKISAYVRDQRAQGNPVQLVFVCTHNSRRSHMSQLWAAAASSAYGIEMTTYSGGTEDTAFNPRAVVAMQRAGFEIEKTTDAANPIYHVRMSGSAPAMTCFSKVYDSAPNPKRGFGAIMVCDEADSECPFVEGASGRFSLPFVDPKVSDNTEAEAATYDERCGQIAREMLYLMSRVDG